MFDQTFKNIDVIPASPPFDGKDVQQCFPVQIGELTARRVEAVMQEATT